MPRSTTGSGRAKELEPISSAFHDAATATCSNGDCLFNVTIGSALRTKIQRPTERVAKAKPFSPCRIVRPRPLLSTKKAFVEHAFAAQVHEKLYGGDPNPVGYPVGNSQSHRCSGFQSSVWISLALPNEFAGQLTSNQYVMTTDRRFDLASMSKTITATALMAALEDLATHKPALDITLDSSILPYVPRTWIPEQDWGNSPPRKSDLPGSRYGDIRPVLDASTTSMELCNPSFNKDRVAHMDNGTTTTAIMRCCELSSPT